MTENETKWNLDGVIKYLYKKNELGGDDNEKQYQVDNATLDLLEELQQYRAIGTVEEIKKVVRFLSMDNDNGIIEDLQLLNQYQLIGTVEECREARERQSGMQRKITENVLDERKRQDKKWGEQNHIAPVWGMIIGEEYGEMCQAINEFGFNPTPETEEQIYTEAIHTMSSCMAMLECMERNRCGNLERKD